MVADEGLSRDRVSPAARVHHGGPGRPRRARRRPGGERYVTGGRATPHEEIRDDILPAFLYYYERIAGYGFWAAIEKSTGEFLDWFHFRPVPGAPADEPELGYRLRASAWGKGYATEGSCALIRKGRPAHADAAPGRALLPARAAFPIPAAFRARPAVQRNAVQHRAAARGRPQPVGTISSVRRTEAAIRVGRSGSLHRPEQESRRPMHGSCRAGRWPVRGGARSRVRRKAVGGRARPAGRLRPAHGRRSARRPGNGAARSPRGRSTRPSTLPCGESPAIGTCAQASRDGRRRGPRTGPLPSRAPCYDRRRSGPPGPRDRQRWTTSNRDLNRSRPNRPPPVCCPARRPCPRRRPQRSRHRPCR